MSGIQSTCTSLQTSRQSGVGENGSYLQSTNEKIAAKLLKLKLKMNLIFGIKLNILESEEGKGKYISVQRQLGSHPSCK